MHILQKTSLFFNYRILRLLKNLVQVVFPEKCKEFVYNNTIIDCTPSAKRTEDNIQRMCSETNKLVGIHEETEELLNVFSRQVGTSEQTTDMFQLKK